MNMVSVNDYLTNVAQIARKCPTMTLRHAYMRAYREWAQQTQWLRTTIPGQTAANVAQYAIGNDPDLDVIGIFAMQGSMIVPPSTTPQTWPMPPSQNPGGWDSNYQPQQPLTYSYVPEGQFALFPTPDKVYELGITIIITPKEAAVNVPLAPLIKYSNDIEAGALEYLLALPGMPWTDKAEAVVQGKAFRSGVGNGKAEVQRSFNTGAQRVRPRPFVVGGGGGGYYP